MASVRERGRCFQGERGGQSGQTLFCLSVWLAGWLAGWPSTLNAAAGRFHMKIEEVEVVEVNVRAKVGVELDADWRTSKAEMSSVVVVVVVVARPGRISGGMRTSQHRRASISPPHSCESPPSGQAFFNRPQPNKPLESPPLCAHTNGARLLPGSTSSRPPSRRLVDLCWRESFSLCSLARSAHFASYLLASISPLRASHRLHFRAACMGRHKFKPSCRPRFASRKMINIQHLTTTTTTTATTFKAT